MMKTRQGQLYLLQFFNYRAHLSDYFVVQAFSNQSSFSFTSPLCRGGKLIILFVFYIFIFFWDKFSYNPDWPPTPHTAEAGLELLIFVSPSSGVTITKQRFYEPKL